ncbi:MAG TPA: hypothetical protein VIF62_04030, partial [Labilithrix sp.]
MSSQPGVVVVRAPSDVHAPIVAHVARRLRTSGWSAIAATIPSGAPLFREIATQLGIVSLPSDPVACAEAIACAANAKRAAIVAPLPKEGSWDRSVACELARLRATGNIVIVFVCAGELPAFEATTFDIAGELTASDKLRWLSAVAEEAQAELPASDLRALEGWWARARHVAPESVPSLDGLDDAARALLTCLALAGRSLPRSALALFGDDAADAIDSLIEGGAAVQHRDLVAIAPACDARALEVVATDADRLAAAQILAGGPGFDPDPWAWARAAELLVVAGAVDSADAAIAKAVRGIDDPHAAGEIGARWFAAVAPTTGEGGLQLRLLAAQRALAMGEAADAQRWCESASALAPSDPTIALLLGRALMQLGDLVAARVSLQKAERAAESAELQARVAAELAEAAYLGGDLEKAAEHANKAIGLAKSASTRLAARNTIGKIHLAGGHWDLADEHFADDALTAGAAKDHSAELRARLNRGIALLSKGLLEEAKAILERVLDDGLRSGEDRARAHAHSNLGVIAYRQHDYGAALAHWEATTRFPQALRGRMATALTIANLAELRLRLGLVDHAEHAILFGKRLLSGSAPPARSAHFKWVGAQIALARRNTELARREIESAILDAQAARDREYLDMALLVAGRVALEDGDLARTAHALAQAEPLVSTARAKAELAIVRALYLRAAGQPAIDSAVDALSLARAA